MNKTDIISPVYWIDYGNFEAILDSWIREIPNIDNIYLGLSNPDDNINKFITNTILRDKYKDVDIIIVDQREIKTLGRCLAELMEMVDNNWFVYLHTDAEPTPHSFKVMVPHMTSNIGIIESDRIHYYCDTGIYKWHGYHFMDRAFSGFQIFNKQLVNTVIDFIDDDYIYRNEDIIFQNICERKGYKYIKTLGMHLHLIYNTKWTFPPKDSNEMFYKGLIKYTIPNHITIPYVNSAIKNMGTMFKQPIDMVELREWISNINPNWASICRTY